MKPISESGIIGLAALREAATGECRQIMVLVHAALTAKLGLSPDQEWMVNVEAMYCDRVIARRDGRFYSYPYTIGADNKVLMGEPTEVLEEYVPVTMREALNSSVFLEAKDPEGAVWDAVLIRAGQANGTALDALGRPVGHAYYPDAVLREAAPLFEGARVFAKPDEVHRKGGGKDVHSLAGWISSPRFVEGKKPDTGYVAGRVNLTAGALRDTITDAWRRGKHDLVALSIDALGSAFREAKRLVAKAITKVNSVDLIVEPGAGGALVRLVEAADSQETSDMKLRERMLATILVAMPATHAKLLEGKTPETVDEEALEVAYREAVAKPAPQSLPQGTVTQEALTETVRMVEARAYLRTAVHDSKLPQPAQDKLLADWSKREKFIEAEVDAAIKAERVYVARFSESGKVALDNEGNLIEVEDRSVKMADMLDAFFDPAHKHHRQVQSFRECYVEMTGDKRVTGRVAEMDSTRMAEAMGAAFRESMDSTTLSNVLGDALTRRMLGDYRTPSQYDVWRPLASIVPLNDFRTQHRTRYGGYGDLPIVAQGDPYTALASPTDEEATYTAAKRGGTEDITLEMVKNDDVGAIRQIPIKLSRSGKRTLGKFVLDFIRTNPVIYDGVAFFDAAHGNLGSAALDATSLAARRLAVLKQTEAGSGDRLSIPAKNLLVPVDLESAGVNLFNRDTNLDKTFIQMLQLTVIPIWYWTDATDWALTVDKDDEPWLELGFLDGDEEPSLFVQDNPTVGSVFSNDKITYKIRHIYGGNVTNYRGADKSVVAG